MIAISSVSKGYVGQPQVLDEINLELKKGDFLYVVGGSGAGKSSLLRLLATEEEPSTGVVSLFGYNLAQVSLTTLRAIRQALGYIPQGIQLIPDLSVYDNIALCVSLAGRRGAGSALRGKIGELLAKLQLEAHRNHLARNLSGGEAQRVAVARALARSPELLIADEPTGAQDRDSTWSMMDLLLKANAAGTTVVCATHDREIVRRIRKKCAVLKDGQITLEEGVCIY